MAGRPVRSSSFPIEGESEGKKEVKTEIKNDPCKGCKLGKYQCKTCVVIRSK